MTHSNITTYIESFIEGDKLYIVMEYADGKFVLENSFSFYSLNKTLMEGGDLAGLIKKKKDSNTFFSEDQVLQFFVQICLAIKHVQYLNYV